MAGATERNEIAKGISLQVVLVLAGDEAEVSEWDDVMHVKRPLQFFLGGSANLATIAIAFACGPTLGAPIGAVVLQWPALPFRAVAASVLNGPPSTCALHATELALKFADVVALASKRLAAGIARYCDRRSGFISPVTFTAAKVVLAAVDSIRRTMELNPTDWTTQGDRLETGRTCACQGRVVRGHALAVTEMMVARFELIRASFNRFSAVCAEHGCLGRQRKPPVSMTDALAEGAPVANRRLRQHIKLPAIRQQQMRPQHQRVYHELVVRATRGRTS